MSQKPKYRVDTHFFPGSTDSERQSFKEGAKSGEENSYIHAFYAGVGYGKAKNNAGVGFRDKTQQRRFKQGVEAYDQHFVSGEEKKSLMDMLIEFFGFKAKDVTEKTLRKGRDRAKARVIRGRERRASRRAAKKQKALPPSKKR